MSTNKTEYMREWRYRNPAHRERHNLAHKCASKALRQLRLAHPEQYEALVNRERAKVGLPRLGASRTGRPPGPSKRASA